MLDEEIKVDLRVTIISTLCKTLADMKISTWNFFRYFNGKLFLIIIQNERVILVCSIKVSLIM